jgi:trimeric autotransporter adhesin
MIMIQKLMRNSVAAAGFAALLLVGACASHDNLSDTADVADSTDQVIQVQPEASTVDVTGNMDRSPIVPDSTTVTTVDTTATLNTDVDSAPLITTPSVSTTTTTVETTTVPANPSMTSSVQESTTTTTTDDDDDDDATPARTRMRKD